MGDEIYNTIEVSRASMRPMWPVKFSLLTVFTTVKKTAWFVICLLGGMGMSREQINLNTERKVLVQSRKLSTFQVGSSNIDRPNYAGDVRSRAPNEQGQVPCHTCPAGYFCIQSFFAVVRGMP